MTKRPPPGGVARAASSAHLALAIGLAVGCRELSPDPPAPDPATSDEGLAGEIRDEAPGDEVPADAGAPARDPLPASGAAVASDEAPAAPALPLAGCAAAERLAPELFSTRSVLRASGSTALAADTSRSDLAGCRDHSSGPDRWYRLDLGGFEQEVEIQAVVDASFDAVLELRQGACGDVVSLDCDRARGIAVGGSSIATRLEPGAYWLVVDGADAASRGDFQLQVELDPAPGRCTSSAPQTSCATPLPLEPLALQTSFLDEACLEPDESRLTHAWYELDLRGETRSVLVHATAWTLSEPGFASLHLYDAADTECDTELALSFSSSGLGRSNAELRALLPPAQYRLELELDVENAPQRRAALQLELDREACRAGPVANQCADAIAIDPNLAHQVLEGNTACNADLLQPFCAEFEAPEQFYRLDLRSHPGPVRARVTTLVDGLDFQPVLELLAAEGDGVCPEPVYCDTRINDIEGPPQLDLTLDPKLYYVVIDGADQGQAGAYRLLVELEPGARRPCVDQRIDSCVNANSQVYCCFDWSPACETAVELCGLERSTQECLCTTAPECCATERDTSACRAARAACNYLCPEFAASDVACLARP